MTHQIQDFDFYKPVLSTDVIKVEGTVRNDSSLPDHPTVKINKNKKKGIRKEKSRLPQMRETQEDIDAWIAERKKNFPTRSRTTARINEKTERVQRGAIAFDEEAKKPKISRTEGSTKAVMRTHSFLDELTKDEERRERSIILQCFRYFVQHDFLQTPTDYKFNSKEDEIH